MIALLRRRVSFRRLWLAEVVSMLGDWLSLVAVASVAVTHGDGALSIAWVLVAHTLPKALLTPIAGPVADRFDRRAVLAVTYAAQAALTVLMLGAALGGWVTALTALVWLRASAGAFAEPARGAAMKDVVEEDELLTANALDATTWSVMFSVGMALGGLFSALSPALALALDALTFVGATALVLGLPRLAPPRPDAPLAPWRAFVEAGRAARGRPDVVRALTAKAPVALAGGAGWVLMNLVSERASILGSAAITFGLLQAVRGIGTGIGPALSERAARDPRTHRRLWVAAQLAVFASVAALALPWGLGALLAVVFVWGLGTGGNWVLASAELQRRAPGEVLGRLTALDVLLHTGAMGVGALAFGGLVDAGGGEALSVGVPVTAAVLAFVVLGWLQRERLVAAVV
ncbi:MAG: MFS transporter [Sandaracinaceae bacterium]|nr:MFS transporter [Sandaracinaceae bacterium]